MNRVAELLNFLDSGSNTELAIEDRIEVSINVKNKEIMQKSPSIFALLLCFFIFMYLTMSAKLK